MTPSELLEPQDLFEATNQDRSLKSGQSIGLYLRVGRSCSKWLVADSPGLNAYNLAPRLLKGQVVNENMKGNESFQVLICTPQFLDSHLGTRLGPLKALEEQIHCVR
jgi:hypothetical protein